MSSPENFVRKAYRIARIAHGEQVDKQGRNYVDNHLEPVAEILRPFGPEAEAAGWLHDVLEDTPWAAGDLEREGIPAVVVEAVLSVTRRPPESYRELIDRACAHPLGRLVKLADNWVNLTGLHDLAQVDPATASRLRGRYESARVRLTASLVGEA